jgi:hypothetical protein
MRSRLRFTFQLFTLLATTALLAPNAVADLRYTMTISIDSPAMQNMPSGMMPQMSTVYYYAPNKERNDSSMKSSFINTNTEVIDDCTSGDVYTIDPALNIYTMSDMSAAAPDPFGISGAMAGMGSMGKHSKDSAPKYDGTVTMNFAVTDIGLETINDVKARHHKIVITTTSTGNVPPVAGVITIDSWTDGIARPVGCATKRILGANGMPSMTPPAQSGVKYIFTGDMLALGDTLKGVPVRLQFTMSKPPGGDSHSQAMMENATITMDRTDLSTDKLDDSTFEPPTGATEVTEDQFNTQKQNAIMKNMGGGGLGHLHFHL